MLLLIDNYDSFTYNLVHFLGELGAEAHVVRNDKITVADAIALKPQAIVLSPGEVFDYGDDPIEETYVARGEGPLANDPAATPWTIPPPL